MPDPDALPIGRLNDVRRTWDYQGGWVRAPFYEIMFNKRLTKQARLLWLWLSWVRPDSRNISWADCEETMCCGTKARRLCLSQLVQEGFVTVQDDGVVILHDPYDIYQKTHGDIIPEIRKEFSTEEECCNHYATVEKNHEPQPISKTLTEPIVQAEQPKEKNKPATDKDKRAESVAVIIATWNDNKPKSYSKIRTVSGKQLEAVGKHLRNLSLKHSQLPSLIQSVCKGIERSDFWLNKVDQSGRNFSAIFGYGNPHDTKLKNVENLYMLGQDDSEPITQVDELSDEQKELIKAYKYISFEYEKARNRNNQSDMNKWQQDLDQINQQLQSQNISMEAN